MPPRITENAWALPGRTQLMSSRKCWSSNDWEKGRCRFIKSISYVCFKGYFYFRQNVSQSQLKHQLQSYLALPHCKQVFKVLTGIYIHLRKDTSRWRTCTGHCEVCDRSFLRRPISIGFLSHMDATLFPVKPKYTRAGCGLKAIAAARAQLPVSTYDPRFNLFTKNQYYSQVNTFYTHTCTHTLVTHRFC